MACSYPVSTVSSPACILQAFIDSGYFGLLNASQQSAAQADPVGWLQSHPYLYSAYPTYFSEMPTSSAGSSPIDQAFQSLLSTNEGPPAGSTPTATSGEAVTTTTESAPQSRGIMGALSKYWLWIVVAVVAIIAIWFVMKRR